MFEVLVHSEHELEIVAATLLNTFPDRRIFAFHGEMGAGKTTFIKAICRLLGVRDQMSSPTFSLVNEYITESGIRVYHFDLYRLKSVDEALEAGLEEYFYFGNYCFVEWPEKAPDLLPAETVIVHITSRGTDRIIAAQTTD